jgi:signal transduction histidine kinase
MERWLESFARTAFVRSPDTAHDLKTPLNVAVLNLELLRMRVRKLTGVDDDPKLGEYTRAIEIELRRMAAIFDMFFLMSAPPKGDEAPRLVDAAALCSQAASSARIESKPLENILVRAHESRIRDAFRLFFEGAAKVLSPESIRLSVGRESGFAATLSGRLASPEIELSKIFKFYYTDPQGNPDLSLAAARLIVETYGGELNAAEESDKVTLRLSLPPGEQ